MRPLTIDPHHLEHPEHLQDLIGAVLTEEARSGEGRWHKGRRLTEADLALLPTLDHPVHAVLLDADEIHEDPAGTRLAELVAGEGITIRPPVQSRVNLNADRKGLLRVDARRVADLNRIDGIAVFTLPDRLAVIPGRNVAGTKITPVAVPRETLDRVADICAGSPVVCVKPFLPLQVGVIATEELTGKTLERFRQSIEQKMNWYGASVLRFADVPNDPDRVAAAIESLLADGADLILTGGGNTMDPLDPALLALPRVGASMIKYGAPAHPGSMFWLAKHDLSDTPIFNMASCSMYSRSTFADLLLPLVMAGELPTLDDLAEMGYGGLLDRGMAYRFPPYDQATANDDEE